MEIIVKKINEIKPYEKNPRKNDNAIDDVAKSIKEYGFKVPIIIDSNNIIVAGHTRYKAAKKLQMTELPCIVADDLTQDQIRAFRIADNRVSELAEWDMDILKIELESIEDLFTGFNLEDFEEEAEIFEDDFVPEPPEEPSSKLGDIYKLGNHRLMCGDSTKSDDVKKLMNGEKAHMIWTDPPWNVNYGADQNHPNWKPRTIMNDKMSTEDFFEFLKSAFQNMKDNLLDGGLAYVAMSAQEWGSMMQVMSGLDFHWSSTIIWAKDKLVMSRKDYHTQYEPIWYGWLNSSRICPLEDRKQSDLWQIDRPRRSDEHPTMKPIELVARSINNSSKKGNIIIDLFGGSGTTLIASEETNRKCFMMELDPKYVDVIINRWQLLTGEIAEKIN